MSDRTVLLTGLRGYLGGGVFRYLQARDWRVIGLTRNPNGIPDARRFQLGEPVDPNLFRGATSLVHCAYDFSLIRPHDIRDVNVRGTALLFAAARTGGVRRIVYVSSISAFPGCQSIYGRTKLEIEVLARDSGAVVLRPGLIFNASPGAMFGRLVAQVARARVVPLLGNGSQVQYLVHLDDVCEAVRRFVAHELPVPDEPLVLADPRPWPLRELLVTLAQRHGRRPRFVSVPPRLVWMALRAAEQIGLRLTFRSDSIVSLLNQNPAPDFVAQQRLGLACRAFA
jgi:nucleoside-diphosphate-sugar epimerase